MLCIWSIINDVIVNAKVVRKSHDHHDHVLLSPHYLSSPIILLLALLSNTMALIHIKLAPLRRDLVDVKIIIGIYLLSRQPF